jgi:hypothetical protein
MRKSELKKLALSKETLLSLEALSSARGGLPKTNGCDKETFSDFCETHNYCPFLTEPCPIWV